MSQEEASCDRDAGAVVTGRGRTWRAGHRPAEELRAGPVTLRRILPGDAGDLARAVLASVDHLRPWMPWADPYVAEDAVTYTETSAQRWLEGSEFSYRIGGERGHGLLGACSLMARLGPGSLEIGYWVRADAIRQGLATRAAAALTVAALGLPDVDEVEIHHDVDNLASGGVPRRLGFERRADLIRAPAAPAETGRLARWCLVRSRLGDTEAARLTAVTSW